MARSNNTRATRRGSAAGQAHADMAEALRGIGVTDLNGLCLEASCLLCAALRSRGEGAKLVRRWSGERGGHWSVETKDGELDPTIAYWDDAPPDAVKGQLYRVVEDSPHMQWERDSDVNEAVAMAVAEGEFGGDLLDLLGKA